MKPTPIPGSAEAKKKSGDRAFWTLAVLIAVAAIITTLAARSMRADRLAEQDAKNNKPAVTAPAAAPE